MNRLKGWLYGSLNDPAWPIRCGSAGCDDAAYQGRLRHDGTVRWACDDCAAHTQAFLKDQEHNR